MADDQNRKTSREHAEGSHGPKTHSAFIDTIQHGRATAEDGERVERTGSAYGEVQSDGKHRLDEDRQQHDEAEKNSDSAKEGRGRARSETGG